MGECHYQSGNYEALVMAETVRRILDTVGINRERFTIDWASAAEGPRFVKLLTEFTEKIKTMGPLGEAEGLDWETLKFRLEAARNLCKNMQFRAQYGNLAKEIKKLGDYSPENISQAIEKKLVPQIRKRIFEAELKELIAQGPQALEVLKEKTGATEEEIGAILETLKKKEKK